MLARNKWAARDVAHETNSNRSPASRGTLLAGMGAAADHRGGVLVRGGGMMAQTPLLGRRNFIVLVGGRVDVGARYVGARRLNFNPNQRHCLRRRCSN